ncbi:45 kDa calcium-binding protein [Linum perenne]
MARAVGIIFYALLTGSFVLIITIISFFSSDVETHRPHRRLGYVLPPPTHFDPLIEKMQREAQEKVAMAGEVEPESVVYFGEDGKFNITKRLEALFPAVDKSPVDGKINFHEMEEWNMAQAVDRLAYRTQKELLTYDKDRDGAISFPEFLPQFSGVDIEKNETGYGQAGWWMKLFKTADVNGNRKLDFYEFNNFLHPEDSQSKDIQLWLLKGNMKRMDDDGDEVLNFAEFSVYVYAVYKTYAEFEKIRVPTAEEKFAQLDVDHDKLLSVEELLPILPYLKPGELTYAKFYSHYLIGAADDNKDEHLTLQEMLNHETIFYTTIYDSVYEHDDYHEL